MKWRNVNRLLGFNINEFFRHYLPSMICIGNTTRVISLVQKKIYFSKGLTMNFV